jgi:putative NIF3 family GTP cyclohydrolase 1 type 2
MDFDNVGLLVGAADAAVGKVMLALDITPAVGRKPLRAAVS